MLIALGVGVSTNAQSLINYSATLFYNSTTNPKTVQVTLFVQNTNNGNGIWVDLAAIQFSLRYNSTYFTLASYSMYPSGAGLDAAGDSNPFQPDNTTNTSLTIKGQSYQSLNIIRSTNVCANVLRLAPGSASVPVFTAVFQLTNAVTSNYYDFTTPSATNYPAEFQTASSPTTAYKDILMNASSSYDQNGTDNSCQDGNIKLKSLTDDPNTPTEFANVNGPLPVKWGNFDVVKQNDKVNLYWQTETEINNKGFEIQQRVDNQFRTIAFVPSQSVSGNSDIRLNYSVNGINIPSGTATTYFRIKQVGLDNSFSYSEVKTIRNDKILQVLVYPNPSNGLVNVILPSDIKDNLSVSLTDISGKTLRLWNNFSKQTLSVDGLPKGIYFLKISANNSGEVKVQKITIL